MKRFYIVTSLIVFQLILLSFSIKAQTFVTWQTGVGGNSLYTGTDINRRTDGATTITGTVNLGGATGLVTATVTASVNTSTGWDYWNDAGFSTIIFSSDKYALYNSTGWQNIVTNTLGTTDLNKWFWSFKSSSNPATPPSIIKIKFDKPVVISELGLADVDVSGTNNNESFTITGYAFTSQTNNLNNYSNPDPTVNLNSVDFENNTSGSGGVGQEYIKFVGTSVLPADAELVITFNGKIPPRQPQTGLSNLSNNNMQTMFAVKLSPPCYAGTSAPVLSSSYGSSCAANTFNLGSVTASNKPSETFVSLKWYTTPDLTTEVSPLTVGAGTYYAAFYDATYNCKSPYKAFTVYPDYDCDGIPNHIDLDNDNDGILDADEYGTCPDGIVGQQLYTQDFGSGGRANLAGVSTNATTGYTYQSTNGNINNGYYALLPYVYQAVNYTMGGCFSDWLECTASTNHPDHTSGDTDGRMMIINGNGTSTEPGSIFFKDRITNVAPYVPITVSFWVKSIVKPEATQNNAEPIISFKIQNTSGSTIATSPAGAPVPNDAQWHNYKITLNPGNNTSVDLVLLNSQTATNGNDFALDDISVFHSYCDTDNDGIPDYLDLDSDGDGCFDAIEGDENVLPEHLKTNGSINGAVDVNGVPVLVNSGGAADIGGDQGQAIGQSKIVNPAPVSGTATSSQTICSGTPPNALTLSGHTGSIQWQVSTDSISFNNISGATSSIYSPGNLTQKRYYRAIVSSAGGCTATSNIITINVNPLSVAGTATENQTICKGATPSPIHLSGYTGTIQWQSSTDNSTFSNIPIATNPILSPSALTQTMYYRAVVTSGICPSATSNTITITVNTPPTITTQPLGGTYCQNSSATLSVATSGTSPISYQWQSSTDSLNFTNISGATSSTYSPANSSQGSIFYRAVATNYCGSVNSNVVRISVLRTPTATISGTTSLCLNSTSPQVTFTNPQSSNVIVTYTLNSGADQTINISANSSAQISVPTSTAGTFTYTLKNVQYTISPNCLTNISGSAVVTIHPNPTLTSSVTHVLCSNESSGEVVLAATGGSSPYTYSKDGVSYVSSNTFSNLASGTYTFYVKDANGCTNSTTATITQNTPLAATVDAGVLNCGKAVSDLKISSIDNLQTNYQYKIEGTTDGVVTGWRNGPNFNNITQQGYKVYIRRKNDPLNTCTYLGLFEPYNICVDIEKTSNISTVTNAGTNVTYTFTVANTGDVDLYNFEIKDTIVNFDQSIALVPHGDTIVFTHPYTITQADIDKCSIVNIVKLICRNRADLPIFDADTNTISVNALPSWTITKDAVESSYSFEGDTIHYNITLSNTGNMTISGITLTDPNAVLSLPNGDIGTDSKLSPGETWTYTAYHVLTHNDIINNCKYDNTVTAKGTPACGTLPNISASTSVPKLIPAPIIQTITQPNCIDTIGTVTLSNLPEDGTWILTASPGGRTISGNNITTAVFSGLIPNTTYTFTVSQPTGCSSGASTSATINPIPTPPSPPLAQNTSVCYDGLQHTASASVGAGQEILWYTSSTGNTLTIQPTGTSSGIYQAYASTRDTVTGCESTTRTLVTLSIGTLPKFTVSSNDISCFGANNGSITVTGEGGSGQYIYYLEKETTSGSGIYSAYENSGTAKSTPHTFENLGASNYKVKIMDTNGCE